MPLLSIVLPIVLVVAIFGLNALVLILRNPASRLGPHYYVSLGNSISFGYQPDDNITQGFTDDLYADLRQANVTDLLNYSCGGESSVTMIQGGCQFRFARHVQYTGPQLDAAVSFLRAHVGQVNPITLEIGANDVLPDFNEGSCSASSGADADLATLDTNLTQTILPRLLDAIKTPGGHRGADLVLLNYYNPFAKECPNSQDFIHTLNDHLLTDAAQFQVPVVDVYSAFGGDANSAANVCTLTWMCSTYHDVHPTTQGYRVIATAVEQVLGYPVGQPANPLQAAPLPAGYAPADVRRTAAVV
ncbi:MAG TPA: SGNH/GDSL hydrolase family protein [Dehalococcoidia bacterium]|nr:SGNH/GDSL hydrolase family protein [Dehalococcoidia bacterium]